VEAKPEKKINALPKFNNFTENIAKERPMQQVLFLPYFVQLVNKWEFCRFKAVEF